jgi:uncharacterized membrane protein YdbT with pleckstrin-like domain
LIWIIEKLIRDFFFFFFFFFIVFAIIRGRVLQRVEWAFIWIVLRGRSFTVGTMVVRAKGFIMASSLALKTYGASHICRKNFVDE